MSYYNFALPKQGCLKYEVGMALFVGLWGTWMTPNKRLRVCQMAQQAETEYLPLGLWLMANEWKSLLVAITSGYQLKIKFRSCLVI